MNEMIEQAAREYCNKQTWPNDGLDELDKKECIQDFVAGATYALSHQWISVDKELPTEKRILAKLSPSFCGREDYLEILNRIPIEMVDLKPPLGYYDCCGESVPTSAITHWMEIQSLEGGEE